MSKGKPARFVHPKVSMAVGEKVGVGSLRRSMVNQSLSRLDFDLGVGESFGQQESLTRRLKHILQMYPEGPRYKLVDCNINNRCLRCAVRCRTPFFVFVLGVFATGCVFS